LAASKLRNAVGVGDDDALKIDVRHRHQQHGRDEIVDGGVVDEKDRQLPALAGGYRLGNWFVGHLISPICEAT
jgi:hypothetical protein